MEEEGTDDKRRYTNEILHFHVFIVHLLPYQVVLLKYVDKNNPHCVENKAHQETDENCLYENHEDEEK